MKYASSQAMNDLLSITEVGERTGLPSSTLRYYERAGLVEPAARIGGRRHYSPDVLQRLAIVSMFQDAGFTIGEIGELVSRRKRWKALAEEKLSAIDAHLELMTAARDLLTAALECSCEGLETCELVATRRGPHRRAAQTLTLRMGPPDS